MIVIKVASIKLTGTVHSLKFAAACIFVLSLNRGYINFSSLLSVDEKRLKQNAIKSTKFSRII